MNDVGIYKLSERAIIPFQATEMSACYDLSVCFYKPQMKVNNVLVDVDNFYDADEDSHVILQPGNVGLFPTGMIFTLPENHHLKLYTRSGRAWKKNLKLHNQVGVIDRDYMFETFIMLKNDDTLKGKKITDGMVIAQCELCENTNIEFEILNNYKFETFKEKMHKESKRDGGFGSTS